MGKGPIQKAGRISGDSARRITGISIGPLGGIQWSDPGPSPRERVRRFILQLEDIRSLYHPVELLADEYFEETIHTVRAICTDTLATLSEDGFAVAPIRHIRSACRRYLHKKEDYYQKDFSEFEFKYGPVNHLRQHLAMLAGELRATVGYQTALLAGHYDLDVEENLASIFPALDEDQE
jgi:hypothetical protein